MSSLNKYNFDDFSISLDEGPMVCVDCKFRRADFISGGQVIIKGYANCCCSKFEDGKPDEVLSGEKCMEYIKE